MAGAGWYSQCIRSEGYALSHWCCSRESRSIHARSLQSQLRCSLAEAINDYIVRTSGKTRFHSERAQSECRDVTRVWAAIGHYSLDPFISSPKITITILYKCDFQNMRLTLRVWRVGIWYHTLMQYTALNLTYEMDIFPGLHGLA